MVNRLLRARKDGRQSGTFTRNSAPIGLVHAMRGLSLILALASAPSGDEADRRVAELLAAEQSQFLPRKEADDPRCAGQVDGEIVVCGRRTDTARYRVPSTIDEAPLSSAATRTGVPHVGQSLVTDLPDCSPGHGCISGGWAPPPVYYFDMTKIPDPAPGSDADKIAKGEMRGN